MTAGGRLLFAGFGDTPARHVGARLRRVENCSRRILSFQQAMVDGASRVDSRERGNAAVSRSSVPGRPPTQAMWLATVAAALVVAAQELAGSAGSRPGCPETRIERLHAHHMRHWLFGGRTELANLVLLSDADHGLVHDHDLVLSRHDGRLVVLAPDGRRIWGTPTPRSPSRWPAPTSRRPPTPMRRHSSACTHRRPDRPTAHGPTTGPPGRRRR